MSAIPSSYFVNQIHGQISVPLVQWAEPTGTTSGSGVKGTNAECHQRSNFPPKRSTYWETFPPKQDEKVPMIKNVRKFWFTWRINCFFSLFSSRNLLLGQRCLWTKVKCVQEDLDILLAFNFLTLFAVRIKCEIWQNLQIRIWREPMLHQVQIRISDRGTSPQSERSHTWWGTKLDWLTMRPTAGR